MRKTVLKKEEGQGLKPTLWLRQSRETKHTAKSRTQAGDSGAAASLPILIHSRVWG